MITPTRRSIARGLVVAAVAVAALAWDGAVGQVGDVPQPGAQIRADDTVSPPIGEGSDGGTVVSSDGVTQARLGTSAVSAVTTSCPEGRRFETNLSLMEHMSLQSHCDFP